MARFICTNCSSWTSTLYKVYSTPGSIQLTTCKNCGRDVDPYIEREWLLVIMDCVLHRPEAIRHVIYNREPFCDIFSCGTGRVVDNVTERESSAIGNEQKSSTINPFGRLIRYYLVASLLRTYLGYIAMGPSPKKDDYLMPKLFVSLAQSFLGECIMLITTILVGSYICKNTTTLKTHDAKLRQETIYLRRYFFSRLYIALTVPAFFHVATIFALIWEHSSTVCTLGTLVVLSLQCLGISIVMDAQLKWNFWIFMSNDKIDMPRQEKQFWVHLKQSVPFGLGLSARTLCVHVFGKMHNVGGDSSPCAGIDLFGTGSFCIV